MKRAVIFCNGEIRDYDYHKARISQDDYVIAVDGGGRHCKALNIIPHLALGDFDSLSPSILGFYRSRNVEIMQYPNDKNYIDMALAIDVALERGYDDIVVFGALGGKRIDMEIANILLLSRYTRNITIEDENRIIRLIDENSPLVLKDLNGMYFSLIPLSSRLVTGESAGLLYQLLDLEFTFGETRSVSNEITADYCRVEIKEGKALAICQKK
ncbi:MAG: thiamine diphosphokinase [Bacillota bacterium]|nr:thiamine diphosphokinase [Bacillota bacterium]